MNSVEWSGVIVFLVFLLLAALTVARPATRRRAFDRTGDEWMLDGVGLLAQGIAVPAMQAAIVYGLLAKLVPEARGALHLSGASAFLLNFVLVDYIYYWNHRGLHSAKLWPLHAVHHTASQTDVFISSRNTIWTPLLIVYMWFNGLFLFLLQDHAAFLTAAALTAGLDLWRHTTFTPRPASGFSRILGWVLITPNEHGWHHSRDRRDCNFGGNLSWWDRLHGTYYSPESNAVVFGTPLALGLKRKLLFPFVR
jgi:sterol desaturase/sphingolipid hydroxylase (fatty acid hydroxylase superfamily)